MSEQMLTEEQIITIKKAAIATDPGKPWGDSIAFARAIESAVRAEYADVPPEKFKALYRPMRTAPKNGHAVLALVEGSDIPRAIRWLASDDSRALSGAGWYMTWDDTFVDPAIDGPRYWMPIADDPDAIDNGAYNPKIGGEE